MTPEEIAAAEEDAPPAYQNLFGSDACKGTDIFITNSRTRNGIDTAILVHYVEFRSVSEGAWIYEDLTNESLNHGETHTWWDENLARAQIDTISKWRLLQLRSRRLVVLTRLPGDRYAASQADQDALERLAAQIGHHRVRRCISNRDHDVRALVGGTPKQIAQETHRARCMGQRREAREVKRRQQHPDRDTDRLVDIVVLDSVRAIGLVDDAPRLCEHHDQRGRIRQVRLVPVEAQRLQRSDPLVGHSILPALLLLRLRGLADLSLALGIGDDDERPGLLVGTGWSAGRGADRVDQDLVGNDSGMGW